jgi:ABC-type nitrate/sulfonate/bicarbonate transport system substrate-binding protein
MATTRRFIQKNPDVVRKYAKAQIEAVHRLKKDRGTTLKILAKYFVGVKDAEAFEKAYDRVVTHAKIVPPKQYPTIEGIKSVSGHDGRERDESGFVDRLYQRGS